MYLILSHWIVCSYKLPFPECTTPDWFFQTLSWSYFYFLELCVNAPLLVIYRRCMLFVSFCSEYCFCSTFAYCCGECMSICTLLLVDTMNVICGYYFTSNFNYFPLCMLHIILYCSISTLKQASSHLWRLLFFCWWCCSCLYYFWTCW